MVLFIFSNDAGALPFHFYGVSASLERRLLLYIKWNERKGNLKIKMIEANEMAMAMAMAIIQPKKLRCQFMVFPYKKRNEIGQKT